jgi:hypothetical protein
MADQTDKFKKLQKKNKQALQKFCKVTSPILKKKYGGLWKTKFLKTFGVASITLTSVMTSFAETVRNTFVYCVCLFVFIAKIGLCPRIICGYSCEKHF